MFSTIFWAVPDFIRVEPEMASGPTRGAMVTWQTSSSRECGLVQRPMGTPPRSLARRSPART